MADKEREKIHHELLDALYSARKQVEYLEKALAHSASFLGTGIERESPLQSVTPQSEKLPDVLARYLELVEPGLDISNYIGREGDDASRPRLGTDAPALVRPKTEPSISPLVGQLALGHPDDSITFGGPPSKPTAELTADASGALREEYAQAAQAAPQPGEDILPAVAPLGAEPAAAPDTALPELPSADADVCLRSYLALQVLNDGVWDWDVIHDRVHISDRWQAIVGISPPAQADALATLVAGLHPADGRVLRSRIAALLDEGVRVRMAVRLARQQGTWGWGILRAMCLRANGKPRRVVAVLADITAQREAELSLRAGDERFRLHAAELSDVISRFDKEGRFLYVSPNIIRYSAVTPTELIGHRPSDFALSGDIPLFEESIQKVIESGQPVQLEVTLHSLLAGELSAYCRFWPEFGEDGEITAVSALVRDMTYSRQVAESIYAIFKSMEDGFALFEHLGGWENSPSAYGAGEFALVLMNPAFARMFSLEMPEKAGVRLQEVIPEDADLWARCLRDVLVEKKAVRLSLRNSAGGSFELSAYSPERGRVVCIVKDVTEMQRIEQEIRLNEARLAALYRLSQMDAAPEERMVRFSLEQAVKLTGSVIGYLYVAAGPDSDSGFIYRSEPLDAFVEEPGVKGGRLLEQVEAINISEGGFAKVFGGRVPVERYLLAPVTEEGRVVCIAGVANKKRPYTPSDLRQLELFITGMWFHLRRRWSVQFLRRAKEEAEAANRAKNEFLANVSHELRTPLNGILGMLQVLQRSPLNPEQVECVDTANYSGRSLLRIISDILDFSRIEAGRFGLVNHLFDFSATVRSALGMFIHVAEQKNIELVLHIDPAIPKVLVGDDARVRQIIFNLVGNAFKFTEKGRIEVFCELLPRCVKGRTCLYLAVSDTGIGMPEERQRDIFTAFTQLDGSITRRYGGTGLGLPIVQHLVKLMGGGMSVESSPEEGTTIHCSLSFVKPEGASLPVEPEVIVQPPVLPLDILVVEDDAVNQFTLKTLLDKAGYDRVVVVENGRQALEALALRNFDCIITDIQMPVMDGIELTRRIRESRTGDAMPSEKVFALLGMNPQELWGRKSVPVNIPIIALTAYAMAGDKERFLGLGMDYYLAKPVNNAELASMLAHVGMLLKARKEVH